MMRLVHYLKTEFPACCSPACDLFTVFIISSLLSACTYQGFKDNVRNTFTPSDTKMIKYHVEQDLRDIEDLMNRLYLKNPRYEPCEEMRRQKVDAIFRSGTVPECNEYFHLPSHEILAMTFSADCPCADRIFMLGLGLSKSIREAYDIEDTLFITGVQIPAQRLERLYHNLNQVNWRLKTYRDENGDLLFRTNEAGDGGYINMEYEKIFTSMLTRTGDDIYLRDGLMNNFIFRSSAVFLSILSL